MEYTKEDLAFVNFCQGNIQMEKAQEKIGVGIIDKMKAGEELSYEEKDLINYFMDLNLWIENGCISLKTDNECPNVKLCNQVKKGELHLCGILTKKLGILDIEELEVLETQIEKVLINNISRVEWNVGEKLRYFDHEKPIPVGRPDLLMKGTESQSLYVVELKPDIATREHVGQLLSYLGWYKKHLPDGCNGVKGILLAKGFDAGAKSAIDSTMGIVAKKFELGIQIHDVL